MKISSPNVKKFIIFSQKSFSYISGSGTFLKNVLYFRRQLSELEKYKKPALNFFFISGNGTFKAPT